MPKELKDKRYDQYEVRTIQQATIVHITRYLAGLETIDSGVSNIWTDSIKPMGGLWIYGPNGVGKTLALATFANALTQSGKKVAWVSTPVPINTKTVAMYPFVKGYIKDNSDIRNCIEDADAIFVDDLLLPDSEEAEELTVSFVEFLATLYDKPEATPKVYVSSNYDLDVEFIPQIARTAERQSTQTDGTTDGKIKRHLLSRLGSRLGSFFLPIKVLSLHDYRLARSDKAREALKIISKGMREVIMPSNYDRNKSEPKYVDARTILPKDE